ATGGRGLRFLARSLRTSAWISIWLDSVSGGADRNDRGSCDRICEVSRRLRAQYCRRSLSDRTDRPVARVCRQSFDRATGRNPSDCPSHIFEHSRTSRRQDCPKQFYLHKNRRAHRGDHYWSHFWMETKLRGAGIALVGWDRIWLECTSGATVTHLRRRMRGCFSIWQCNGRTSLHANGEE